MTRADGTPLAGKSGETFGDESAKKRQTYAAFVRQMNECVPAIDEGVGKLMAALREAIGARYGLDPARIVAGAGSDEILEMLALAYIGPGDEGLYSQYGFLEYKIVTLGAGGAPVVAPERNYTSDVDALLACVTEKTRLVFIANPNNPTGTYLSRDEIARAANAFGTRNKISYKELRKIAAAH